MLSEGKDVSLLRETIAHEVGHELEGDAGYEQIKEAALAATKQTDIDEWRELYKKNNPEATPEEIDAEIAAKALGRRLATPKFVERFANRSIIRRAIDFGKMLLDALRADQAGRLEIAETEKLIDMMNRALQGANVQVHGENAGKQYNITIKDIDIIRTIANTRGEISINDFSSEDIEKTKKWAEIYWNGTGTKKPLREKSPFFRAWFGEWRAHQTKEFVSIAAIPEYVATNEARKQNRGTVENDDTGWDIRISREGETNTISHSGGEKLSEYGLAGIIGLVENAYLFDTEIHKHHKNNAKDDRIAFDHKLYALGRSEDKTVGLYRITVEETFQDPKHPNDMRFHNLKYIEKVANDIGSLTHKRSYGAESTSDASTTMYSIADLYGFVKQFDKEFTPAPEVSEYVLNEDGTPKVFYHGSDELFTTFGYDKIGSATGVGILGEGFYFTDQQKLGKKYGKNVYKAFLQMSNPYMASQEDLYRLNTEKLEKQGYDGVILKAPNGNIYMALDNTQIKSATDNIGTFDKSNPDIRYNLTPEAAEQAAREAAEVEQFRNEQDREAARVRQAECCLGLKAEAAHFLFYRFNRRDYPFRLLRAQWAEGQAEFVGAQSPRRHYRLDGNGVDVGEQRADGGHKLALDFRRLGGPALKIGAAQPCCQSGEDV